MKTCLLILTLVIISVCYTAISKNKIIRQLTIDKTVYELDSTANTISDEQITRNVDLFKKVHSVWNSIHRINRSIVKGNSEKSQYVLCKVSSELTEYYNLERYGISSIALYADGTPNKISFITSNPRSFTEKEFCESHTTNKIPSSYCTISEGNAIERARVFLDSIFRPDETIKFDSVSVRYDTEDYVVVFSVKMKNDILDWSNSTITINANTGQIKNYFGGKTLLTNSDFNYVPKITKQQALQMYYDERDKYHADIEITLVALDKGSPKDGNQWIWRIYGHRKDKYLTTAAMMLIDSETGEIILKRLD